MVPDSVYWESISQLGQRKTHSKDITLRERPLPVRAMNKTKNIFSVVVEGEEKIADIGAYNQMIFKPHQNAVRLSKQERDLQKDEDGTVVTDEMEYTFKLNDPAIVTKMFRGYDDEEACPWVVKSSFFKNHSLLQYSRWKQGEPVKKASRDVCRMISDYYGGREIVDSRWLASIETAERSFYAVQFAITGTQALAAMVAVHVQRMLDAVLERRPGAERAVAGETEQAAVRVLDPDHRKAAGALGREPADHAFRRARPVVVERGGMGDGLVEDLQDRAGMALFGAFDEVHARVLETGPA
jgi:hypothetical protein